MAKVNKSPDISHLSGCLYRRTSDPTDAPDVTCHRNYFYQKCFTRDGSKLLFGGAFDGPWNYYLLDLNSRVATQLTEGRGDNTFGVSSHQKMMRCST